MDKEIEKEFMEVYEMIEKLGKIQLEMSEILREITNKEI